MRKGKRAFLIGSFVGLRLFLPAPILAEDGSLPLGGETPESGFGCCEARCVDSDLVRCDDLVPDGLDALAGCVDAPGLLCYGGQLLGDPPALDLVEGCACTTVDGCWRTGVLPETGPSIVVAASEEECAAAAVAACLEKDAVVVDHDSAACEGGGEGFCGDGIVQAGLGEECDDANDNDLDGCAGCKIVNTDPD